MQNLTNIPNTNIIPIVNFMRIAKMLKNENIFDGKVLESLTRVCRKKVSGLVAHAGLILNFQCGTQIVLHTNPDNNAHLSSIAEFSDGERLVIKESYPATQDMVDRIERRLFANLKYSIFDNCEHLVNEILTGSPSSTQLKSALFTSALGTASLALASGKKSLGFLTISALGFGLLGLYMEKQNQLTTQS